MRTISYHFGLEQRTYKLQLDFYKNWQVLWKFIETICGNDDITDFHDIKNRVI